jgi:hypothetical protein|tara:strand:+ start:656 stop:1168 length:513 start_codon:yes stop_codon:yes gene_type:complete
MYKIYQIRLADEVTDFVNSNDHGHTGASHKYPIYEAYMRLNHGNDLEFNNADFGFYTQVCAVIKDAGLQSDGERWAVLNLEDVFAVLNGRYYDEDTGEDLVHDAHVSGYTMKSGMTKNGTTYSVRNMRSLSVGDIVEDTDNGTFHMVAGMGFQDITVQVKNFAETTLETA